MPFPIIVADVIEEAQKVYLNDPSGTRFTSTVLLPYVRTVNRFLETELLENNVQTLNEVADDLVLSAGGTEYFPLPQDFLFPIRLEERLSGSTDQFTPMVERPWTPNQEQSDKLKYWIYRREKILFLGATTDREVRLFYQCAFTPIEAVEDSVYRNAYDYLIAGTAAMAHKFISQNDSLASDCNDLAEKELASVINIMTKKKQAMPVRKRPYMPYR